VPRLDKLLEVALHELKGDVVLNLRVVAVGQWARQDHDVSEVVHKAHHAVVHLEQVDLQLDLK
jgi:Flp pilus assembly protein CpaB